MDFSQISQLLRDALAIVESPQVQQLMTDFSADVSGQNSLPPVPVNPAAYRGNPVTTPSNAQVQSVSTPRIDPNNPAGQTIPPRAIR